MKKLRKLGINVSIVALLINIQSGNTYSQSKIGQYYGNTYEEKKEFAESRRQDELTWFYKVENGKTYMRLYNATTQKWLTDWIECN